MAYTVGVLTLHGVLRPESEIRNQKSMFGKMSVKKTAKKSSAKKQAAIKITKKTEEEKPAADKTAVKKSSSPPRTSRELDKRINLLFREAMRDETNSNARMKVIKELKELFLLKEKLSLQESARKRSRNDSKERAAAIADARAILAEIAEAKSGRMAGSREMDKDGKARANNAAG